MHDCTYYTLFVHSLGFLMWLFNPLHFLNANGLLLLLKAQEKEESLAGTADALKARLEVDCFNKSEGINLQH